MMCWHCEGELEFNVHGTATDASKIYHCAACGKWYEMRKERERVNGAVPVRFVELDAAPAAQAR
jgi:hypothetical protein